MRKPLVFILLCLAPLNIPATDPVSTSVSSAENPAAVPVAQAKTNIEGAFGLKLGDVFDEKMVKEIAILQVKGRDGNTATLARSGKKMDTGGLSYYVVPPYPNSLFGGYCVIVTPTTKRIFRIYATMVEQAGQWNGGARTEAEERAAKESIAEKNLERVVTR
ncbi:hypothetical protein Ga0100231_008840 [Opitutaceae bacterium TAV4]|nr:hypothetical protein Ga0100231_008840 [Opitutaceae bacterium TAV4]RRJ98527.1 hypothetical protein Ga0100230_009085 [Opitutaceae bacterium TAV3]